MRQSVVRTVVLVTVALGLAAAASAQDHRCVNPGLTGAWGYTETGTVVAPAPMGPVVAAAVGRYEFDAAGGFAGTQYSSAGGNVSDDAKVGTYVLNPDCTGTLTLEVWDPAKTTLRRRSVWAIVLVDNATEFRGIMTSMIMPTAAGDVVLKPIMTLSARRLFGDRSDQR